MNRLIMAIATCAYVGKIPKAPGTWGSLAALLPWLLIKDLEFGSYCLILLTLFIVGFFVCGSAEKILDTPDAGCIVIDEVLGMFITLTLAPDNPAAWLAGFALFRVFDIFKPFPVSWFDTHIHGGIGIMMDDVAAGIYAFMTLQFFWWLLRLLM
ncbi:phosphatidylglycerophosphatase A family protein [Desulforhopalus singaporensis]|uniref:Phosphatidylglycerophosphatase n=1 Tax=Desulforhopalus singaporensis TaxID=91360 RepID=A0A1H0QY80_9BACT|nr:phosphatidylglycerophosphatase A [Desulforhopalus singaporensis]SDP21708.1 phosphatidylglycerophosphatase [Desulforhopalus singaporensis]